MLVTDPCIELISMNIFFPSKLFECLKQEDTVPSNCSFKLDFKLMNAHFDFDFEAPDSTFQFNILCTFLPKCSFFPMTLKTPDQTTTVKKNGRSRKRARSYLARHV